MQARTLQTRPLCAPKDDLLGVLAESIGSLNDEDIVAVSSKVVAISEGRCIPIPEDEVERIALKEKLIRNEAELYLEKDEGYTYSRTFTINNGDFGSSSGIDESNGNGHFILLPKDARTSARTIREHLMEEFDLSRLGVVVVDSRPIIMRKGAVGHALAHAGFKALFDYRGKEDVFGRKLKVERLNCAECLASAAALMMGEGDERTPVTIFSEVPHMVFGDEWEDDFMLQPEVSMEDDVFAQFLCDLPWEKGGDFKTPENET